VVIALYFRPHLGGSAHSYLIPITKRLVIDLALGVSWQEGSDPFTGHLHVAFALLHATTNSSYRTCTRVRVRKGAAGYASKGVLRVRLPWWSFEKRFMPWEIQK